MIVSDEEKCSFSPGLVSRFEIFEQVQGANSYHFIVWNRIDEKFNMHPKYVWENYVHDGVRYVPLPRLPWPSVSGFNLFDSEEHLFNDIRQYFIDHLDVSNDFFYDVYAAFVLASWRPEDFKVVPYLFFLGPLSSGKTRALECLQRLCYRAILAASMSAASLFRALEAWHPTLFLDESEIYNRKEMVEVLALLNSGYRKGQYAIRIEKAKEGNPEIGMFDTFGFKGIAGTEELAATLQSRCIITPMSRAVRPINLFVDEEKAQQLRNTLLYYRFRNLGKTVDSDVSRLVKENGYFHNSRVIELFISLIQVAPTSAVKQRLVQCMKQITQSRLDEEQASVEARVFDAFLKCESQVENGKLGTQAITEAFNEDLPEKDKGTSRFIGRKVASLGFEKCRVGSRGQNGFFWDIKLIDRLQLRYYPKTTSVTSVTSETTVATEKLSPISGLATDFTEVIFPETSALQKPFSPLKTDVSEQTEVSDVKSRETAHKPFTLAPNDPHPCDGATKKGESCPLEAKYILKYVDNPEVGYFCSSCYDRVRKASLENGFQLEP
jgi:hypothetical protein